MILLPYKQFSELFPKAMLLMGPKIYSGFNITAQQFHALREIRHSAPTVSEMSVRLGLKLPAATRLLRRLEDKGFISRTQDPNDRRIFRVALTTEGIAYMDKLQETRERFINTMFDNLSLEEQEKIVTGIKLLLKSLTLV